MEVKVVIDNSDTIQRYIIENKIDLGLIEGIVHHPFVIEQQFREDELVMKLIILV
jgi:LysR family transcriptional regulator, transcriptional activator of the cysJI operon